MGMRIAHANVVDNTKGRLGNRREIISFNKADLKKKKQNVRMTEFI
jgi:hypothetical protein